MRVLPMLPFPKKLLRSRLCWRIGLAVFASIVFIESAILIPSTLNYERDRIDRLQLAGANAVSAWLRLAPPNDARLSGGGKIAAGALLKGGAVYDAEGALIGEFGERPDMRFDGLPEADDKRRTLRSADGRRLDVVWLPRDLGLPYIVVGRIDSSGIAGDLVAFVIRIIGLVLLISAFATAVTMVILGKLVLLPIINLREKLLDASQNPARGRAFAMPTKRRDEFGDVISAFNQMLEQVADNIAKLDELNRSLEIRVIERTHDLRAAVERSEEANERLRRSEEYFRNMVEGSSEAIVLIDVVSDEIVDANDEAGRLLGYPHDALMSVPVSSLYGGQMPALQEYAAEVGLGNRGRIARFNWQPRTGETIPVELSASMIDLAGRSVMLVQARDMTERDRVEQALRDAKEAAENASRAKTEFLANMSHELRTPLNAVIGFSEIMQAEMFGPLGDDRYKDYTNDIVESARHLLNIINDILDVSKAEAGQLELLEGEVDAARVIASSLLLVEERALRDGVTITIAPCDDLPKLFADQRKLIQIFVNLLSNAAKFTPQGGRVEVAVSLASDGALCFTVSDTGIGMSEEDIVTALVPFGQIDSALSRRYEGTGLGLPLVKAFVELHGGSLDIASVLGEGTRVTVTMPPRRVIDGSPMQAVK